MLKMEITIRWFKKVHKTTNLWCKRVNGQWPRSTRKGTIRWTIHPSQKCLCIRGIRCQSLKLIIKGHQQALIWVNRKLLIITKTLRFKLHQSKIGNKWNGNLMFLLYMRKILLLNRNTKSRLKYKKVRQIRVFKSIKNLLVTQIFQRLKTDGMIRPNISNSLQMLQLKYLEEQISKIWA